MLQQTAQYVVSTVPKVNAFDAAQPSYSKYSPDNRARHAGMLQNCIAACTVLGNAEEELTDASRWRSTTRHTLFRFVLTPAEELNAKQLTCLVGPQSWLYSTVFSSACDVNPTANIGAKFSTLLHLPDRTLPSDAKAQETVELVVQSGRQ